MTVEGFDSFDVFVNSHIAKIIFDRTRVQSHWVLFTLSIRKSKEEKIAFSCYKGVLGGYYGLFGFGLIFFSSFLFNIPVVMPRFKKIIQSFIHWCGPL